jgi:NAD(P)-dependent dehydrogenase (short-subunit alcohol dehydrogenase family)
VNCFDVSHDVVVLTGVSGQLGAQYGSALLEAGARVVGLDVHFDSEVEAMAAAFPDSFIYRNADITSEESLQAALSATRETFGEPTVLINNAAIDSPPSAPAEENGPFENYPRASWDRVLDVNVTGTYLPCQVFGAAMAEAGYGSIINVSSIYGVVSPDQSIYEYRRARGETFYKPVAYSVSKSAILNLTRYLAVYWAKKGVRVNTLVIAGVERGQDAEFLAAYNARIPIGRMARETDYSGPVLFLASRASEYMTGSELVIDGGWTAI